MIPVGGRVVKTGLAAGLTVYIAHLLNLEAVIFGCLVAILAVQRSFYNSVRQSYEIVMSVLLGSLIGTIFAFSFGLHPLAVITATILMILICLKLKWQDQIILAVVTVLTLMEFEPHNFIYVTGDRIIVGLIGVSVGILLNIPFTPFHRKKVEEKMNNLDRHTRIILNRINDTLVTSGEVKHTYCRKIEEELHWLRNELEEGMALAKLFREEQRYRFNPDKPSEKYIENFNIFAVLIDDLEDMNNISEYIVEPVPQVIPVARLSRVIVKMQERHFAGYMAPVDYLSNIIDNLEQKEWWRTLPHNEKEFFTRSALFYFFGELKMYYKNIVRLNPLILDAPRAKKFPWKIISPRAKKTRA